MVARLTVWRLSGLLWLTGLLLSVLWLDALDRYALGRFHQGLEEWARPALWVPSRLRQRLEQGISGQAVLNADGAGAAGAVRAELVPQPVGPGVDWPDLQQQRLRPGPQRVLLAGDSMMKGLAPLVMRELARKHPDWQVVDASRTSTGLTVRRYYDWPTRIEQAMQAQDLTLVVLFLGPNDPWDLLEDGQRFLFPSDGWQIHYARRVDEILRAAQRRQVRVVWLGLPNMANDRLRQGALVLNRIFHDRARTWKTDYLATDRRLGSLTQPYGRSGMDEQGHGVPLRTEDGVHFTPAGLRLLQQALMAHLEKAVSP
jgi:hypothetical protein